MPLGRTRRQNTASDCTRDLFEVEEDPFCFERAAYSSGCIRVAGIDEAGRGPLAGPVVAAAVVLPPGLVLQGVRDSKEVPEAERERLAELIRASALAYGIGIVDETTIDEVNIYQATILAMNLALRDISPPPDYLLIDAVSLPQISIPQKAIIKGDRRSHTIAAASILAKTERDRLMRKLHEQYPQYNFHRHKGYATKEHMTLLKKYGPCPAHRKSFRPVSDMLDGAGR